MMRNTWYIHIPACIAQGIVLILLWSNTMGILMGQDLYRADVNIEYEEGLESETQEIDKWGDKEVKELLYDDICTMQSCANRILVPEATHFIHSILKGEIDPPPELNNS